MSLRKPGGMRMSFFICEISFAELGRRLELNLDSDLSLNYPGYARKPVGL
jgi:hypothetical protein